MKKADCIARLLTMKLGQDALLYTSVRLNEMREAEDHEGLATWTRIHEATQDRLRQTMDRPSSKCH